MIELRSPPPYIQFFLEETMGIKWKPVKLSIQSINNVLKKHGVNGSPYRKNRKAWKYFIAKKPNDMWQIDIKGPFRINGKRMNALLILDDYSRFLVSVQLFTSIKTEDITELLDHCISTYEHPGKILADNGPQFRDTFDKWCTKSKRGIKVEHAPPFYPQCKGKIERCILNFNEEYISLDSALEDIPSFISDYRDWYNTERYNAGVRDIPQNLYMSKNVTDVT